MTNERGLIQIVKEICEESNIEFNLLSYGYIMQLKKENKVVHIYGNRFDINNEAAGRIACDKYATYCVLNSCNIPACEHKIIFNPVTRIKYIPEKGNYNEVLSEFMKYKKLVVKPNDGWGGTNVFLCNSMKEVEEAIHTIFEFKKDLCICPFYEIKKEYRVFYLNDEVKLIYGKERPFVVGNGNLTMKQLIDNLDLPKKAVVLDNLSRIDMNYIPKDGEKKYISWKYNLSGGARPELLEEGKLYEQIKKIAKEAAKAMNIKFATIDVIQTEDNELMILEVNSGVCGALFIRYIDDGYEKMKAIYKEAINFMIK